MPGVWAKDGNDRWRPLTATGFVSEADLHSLIEQTPAMLPLAGTPTLAVVGKEVNCGRERADLLAIEIDTGRPVIIEVKLAANTDRRQALTQVLGYAAYLRRLDSDGLNNVLQGYLTHHGYASIAQAARAAAQADPGFDDAAFDAQFTDALADGRLRAVIVLDSAPSELVELVGYLQEITSDRLTLDLVVVTAYQIEWAKCPGLPSARKVATWRLRAVTKVTAEICQIGGFADARPRRRSVVEESLANDTLTYPRLAFHVG